MGEFNNVAYLVVAVILVVVLVMYLAGLDRNLDVAIVKARDDTPGARLLGSSSLFALLNFSSLVAVCMNIMVPVFSGNQNVEIGGKTLSLIVPGLFLLTMIILCGVSLSAAGRNYTTIMVYLVFTLLLQIVSIIIAVWSYFKNRKESTQPTTFAAALKDRVKNEPGLLARTAIAVLVGIWGVVAAIYTLKKFSAAGVKDAVDAALSAI